MDGKRRDSRKKIYIKLGAFFLVALLVFLTALISMRELTFIRHTYILKVKFDFAEGLRIASPVRFCGVDVGEIKKIVIREGKDKPYVVVAAKIYKNVRIPKGSNFLINSLSLFGEKYIEIIPPKKTEGFLIEGELVEGVSPVPLFNVFSAFYKTTNEVNAFVKEGKIKESLVNTLANLESATLKVTGLIDDVKDKKGTLGHLIYEDDLYTQLMGLVNDVRGKKGTFGKLLYEDALYIELEEFIQDLRKNPWKLLHKGKTIKDK